MKAGTKVDRTFALSLALLLAAALSSFAYAQEVVTLRLATWPGLVPITQKVAEAYNAQSETIKVEVESMGVGWDRFPEYLLPRLTAGNAPDIAYISPINYADLYPHGLIIDMKPYMERDPLFDPSEYWPALLRWAERDGAVYAFPASTVSYVTYFNTRRTSCSRSPAPSRWAKNRSAWASSRALSGSSRGCGRTEGTCSPKTAKRRSSPRPSGSTL